MSESSVSESTELVKPEVPAKPQGIQYPGGYDPLGRPPSAFNPKAPICGADDKKGGVCGRTSCRKPSDVPGYGGWEYTRCRFHQGMRWKHELVRKGVNLQEKAAIALADNELQDAAQQVNSAAGVVALYMQEMDNAPGDDIMCPGCGQMIPNPNKKLNQISKFMSLADTLSKITKREHEMREGKKMYVKVETVDSLAQQIIVLVHKHFGQYSEEVAAFAEEVKQVRLYG